MNEADIPIDIHTLKLQEWLVSRRIVSKNFQAQIKDIRTKIANAIQDMPANDELIKLLSGSHINYFHCKEIIEILKQTEKDTKSVFGTYGSKRMKDWQEVVKLYEKDNIYLGEAAQILVRNINYEIPNIKKQMNKCEQQSEECLKRIQTISKTENVLLNEHSALCQQLGIQGKNLKEEFLEKLKDLPEIYNQSIKNVGNLRDAVDFYNDFLQDSTHLPILQHVINKGNTTVYEFLNKEAPLKIEENIIKLNIESEPEPEANNEIDFGTSSDSTTSAEMIDFGECDLNSTITLETGDIDWGLEENSAAPAVSSGEIDFNIPLEEYGIVVEGMGMDGGIAKESFLKMRVFEVNQLESSGNMMFSLMDNLSTHDIKSIKKMLENIDLILGELSGERTRHLFQLKHSPKYADILANKLKQKLVAVEKIKVSKEVLKERSVDFLKQKIESKPVLDDMISQTKILQTNIEKDISKRYKNRVVNLMGGVNTL
uniref:CDK5RAP3-like protein n=1 Tax=Megaselia scalaris TaxID=36166 RepID=T1GLB8_MEGSC